MDNICVSEQENIWKAETNQANDFFNQHNFKKAVSGYETCLTIAESLNNHQSECQKLDIPFLQIYIISCNNLSNTYAEMDNFQDSRKMLERVVYFLLHLSKQDESNNEELHSELKRASVMLLDFATKYDSQDKQEKLLKELKEQALAIN